MNFKEAKKIAQMVAAAEGAKKRLEELQQDMMDGRYESAEHYGVDAEVLLEILEEEFERYKKRIIDVNDA